MAGGLPTGNRLLDALPPTVRAPVLAESRRVRLARRDLIFREHQPVDTVYFPVDAVLSLLTSTRSGFEIELSTIGNEGMTGVAAVLEMGSLPNALCLCQVMGDAICLGTEEFEFLLVRSRELRQVCSRYVGLLLTEVGQGVACSRLHTTPQRCARWLLTTQDRVGRDRFDLTHEFIASLLGTRRASVTEALARLSRAGVIRSRRASIEILDRTRLENLACECYSMMRREIAGMLPN